MDALEIMTNIDNVIPYYQPVFSADEHKIIGYEVLGRIIAEDGEIYSLGSFFHDKDIPDEYKLEVDETVTRKALAHFLQEEKQGLLFINRDPMHLIEDAGETFLHMLKEFKKEGLTLDRIVLEISEKTFFGDFDKLVHLLLYYKTYGIKIAIDNVGGESGHWDRLSQFSPDILKVDLHQLRNDISNQAYKNILFSLSMLARKIGSSLLFENIEIEYQLQFAWRNGGRYYQGFYLEKPSPDFLEEDILKNKLRKKCHDFIVFENRHLEKVYSLANELQLKLIAQLPKFKKQAENDDILLLLLANHFSNESFRLYICDENGFQLTSNLIKVKKEWKIESEFRGKNWSWRPYFLENIYKMRHERKGLLSDAYCDIETGELVRTFSYPIGEFQYLFMDLSYDFLFEKDGLLY
jgi:EAL domain-containing protein (putative c-di-GMP-specific phosphodiesterase class I)